MSLGAIAAGDQDTLEAAEKVLKAGGNAFDAAIAACFSLFAAEPVMGSAGAGGFAMCHSLEHGTQLLDFFTQTPKTKDLNRLLDFKEIEVDFGGEIEIFHAGMASIAVPGMVAGLYEIHDKLATMPMQELVQHAQLISKRGVTIDSFGEIDLSLLQSILAIDPGVEDIFFKDGLIKKKGDTMVFPHLPDFLDRLVREGSDGFYCGEIGEQVAKEIYEGGGFLTRADFESYQVKWSKPMQMPYRDLSLCLPNGPSLGGAIMALLDYHTKQGDTTLTELLLIVKEEVHEKGGIKNSMDLLLPHLDYQYQGKSMASKGTSHLSIVDKHGNSIAFTTSLGEGSGYWIPGTDMQLNNMLGETFLLPDGAHSWALDTRMNSMMTPVMLLDAEKRIRYSGGSGGAGRIPYVLYQVLEEVYKRGLTLEEATAAPRQHWHEGTLHYEVGADITGTGLGRKSQCWYNQSLFFGGVNSVLVDAKGELFATGDVRRCGVAKIL